MSRSAEGGGGSQYSSTAVRDSAVCPGVRFTIVRPSLERRAEITSRVRRLLAELEFRAAGQGLEDQLAAAELESRIDKEYIEWGLVRIENLTVDGRECDAKALVQRGPESLAREIANAIRCECRLGEEERKN
jgi:hypothetical protein